MEDTIQKFVKLPAHIRSAVSSPEAIRRLEKIEDTHNVKLADLVMRVTTKELPLSQLESTLESDLGVSSDDAKKIKKDLVHNIFSAIANYLGFRPDAGASAMMDSDVHEGSLGVDQKDAEIEHHASKLKYEDDKKQYDAKAFADNLLEKYSLEFDHVVQKRFEKLIESRLADVREKSDLQDRLTRDTKVGGIGLGGGTAQKIIDDVEEEHKRIHALHITVKADDDKKTEPVPSAKKEEGRPKHPPMKKQIKPPATPSVMPAPKTPEEVKKEESVVDEKEQKSSLAPGATEKAPEETPGDTATAQEAPRPSLAPETVKPASPPEAPKQTEPQTPPAPVPTPAPAVPPPTPAAVPQPAPPTPAIPEAPPKKRADVPHFMPKVLRGQNQDTTKPTMSDIKLPSKLVGPVEELKGMTIKDFRRLGEDTDESVQRIKEMVRKLEKESFERRSEGLKAWRSSDLVKQYLEIGQESMEKNLTVSRIIADRQAKGDDIMTADEFDAIAQLNRSLRY